MKFLQLLTAKDLAVELDCSKKKAETIYTEIRKSTGKKGVTRLHLYDYLGINQLAVISELMHPQNS